MPDIFDTSQVRDDAAHWDKLAERVASVAVRESKTNEFERFVHSRASWVAASVLLAAALAFTVAPSEGLSARTFRSEWVEALAPADEVGRAIVLHDGPPALGALLLGDQRGGAR